MEAFISQLWRAFGPEWFSSGMVLRHGHLKDAASKAAGRRIKFALALESLMDSATGLRGGREKAHGRGGEDSVGGVVEAYHG